MSHRTAARLAWLLWGLALCLAAVGLLFGVLTFRVSLPEGREPFLVPILVQGALLVLYGTLGALIASRQSRNLIGWLFLVVAVSLGLLSVAYGYGDYALYARDNSLPGAELAAWVTTWLFIVAVFGSVCYLFLLFPDGRPTSPRWRPVVWGVTITVVVAILAAALDPGPPSAFPTVKNPLQVGESIGRVARVANDITDFAAIPVFLVSLASMITRLRHARGRERLQLKWMTYAASLTATSFAVAFFASSLLRWQTVADIFFLLGVTGFACLPVAAGIAILRHRLYEIDVVINRTLVYGSLTAMLALVYFGGVTVTQAIFRALTGQEEQPQLAIVVSTLVIAALFNPLRRRIQTFIDRRFYRKKYDAAKTLEAFSVKLRDETDLDALNAELVRVVRETMQPAHVSLWLRPNPAPTGDQGSGEPRG
jgi:hypothetical protein